MITSKELRIMAKRHHKHQMKPWYKREFILDSYAVPLERLSESSSPISFICISIENAMRKDEPLGEDMNPRYQCLDA